MSGPLHPTEDRLIDLAAGLLPPSADAEILRHLESCADCEARFRTICRDAELARLLKPAARPASRWRFAAVAASLLLIAATIALSTRPSGHTDPAAYWFPVELETVGLRTGAPEGDEAVFHDAVEAYKRHDPDRVVMLLGDRPIPEALDPLKIMLASALVKAGEPAKAQALLTELRIDTLPQPDRDRASWILYTALARAGKSSEARRLAESLASRPGEFSEPARREAARLRQSDQ